MWRIINEIKTRMKQDLRLIGRIDGRYERKPKERRDTRKTVPLGVNQKRRVGNSQTGHRM